MIVDKGIKIQNIYYMLAYAFKMLKGSHFEKLAVEEFDTTADLLSAILAKGISLQVKRGLGKEYIPTTEPLSTLRGKIDIASSIKQQTMLKQQLICSYDEFSINTKLNQIIKTTVNILLREDIKSDSKKDLKNLMMYFKEVDTLNPYTIDWNIRFHRNNQNYEILINICYLVIKGLLQKDDKGDMKMQKFLDEQRMCRLYEKFILEYYIKHFPQYRPRAKAIKWDAAGDEISLAMLPAMQSDITLTDGEKTIIIDAKYYTKTFHSYNLYQIFTYVKNKDKDNTGKVSGVLLYAKTDEEITPDAVVNFGGNDIAVRSLDLGGAFKDIAKQLSALVCL